MHPEPPAGGGAAPRGAWWSAAGRWRGAAEGTEGVSDCRRLKDGKGRVAAPAGTLDPWRPKKRHRVSAVKWMGCLDNQLRHGMGKDLAFFTWLDGSEVWLPSNWRRWPMLTGTIDQGSDGLSASNAMTHMKKMNWFCFMDWSHGACNDLERGYKQNRQLPVHVVVPRCSEPTTWSREG